MQQKHDNIRPIGIDWDAQPYATESNLQIAARLGVNPTTVRYHRNRRGYPPFEVARDRIDWSTVVWANKSNAEVAAETGMTTRSVFMARKRMGIPPCTKRGGNSRNK